MCCRRSASRRTAAMFVHCDDRRVRVRGAAPGSDEVATRATAHSPVGQASAGLRVGAERAERRLVGHRAAVEDAPEVESLAAASALDGDGARCRRRRQHHRTERLASRRRVPAS